MAHVLGYLLDNIEAEDTLEGIVEWWLMRQRIKYETEKVKQALSELEKKEFIQRIEGRDRQSRYRINKQKLRAIRAYLKEQAE